MQITRFYNHGRMAFLLGPSKNLKELFSELFGCRHWNLQWRKFYHWQHNSRALPLVAPTCSGRTCSVKGYSPTDFLFRAAHHL